MPGSTLVNIHLVDGTYELFRQNFGRSGRDDPRPFAATIGVLGSTLALLAEGATHVAVASDHVIESFRNDLWPGYKTGEGMDSLLYAQFEPLEDALGALGVVVWPMVEFEADDALAAAAVVVLVALWPRPELRMALPMPSAPAAAAVARVLLPPAVKAVHSGPRALVAKAQPAQEPSEPTVVKLLTNDPDVVIYWITGTKGE